MKKIITVLFVISLFFGSLAPAFASGWAYISLSPDAGSVGVGDSFSLSVVVNPNGESIDTARVVLSYPASLLEVTDFDLGTMFPNPSPGNSIDNTSGVLTHGGFLTGEQTSSSGTFGTVTFRTKAEGTATVSVSTLSRLINTGSEKIDSTSLGSAAITISGDGTGATEVVEAAPTGEAPDVSTENDAIGVFGALTGYMPSSSADWTAVDYILNGHTPAERDLSLEQAGINKFVSVYGVVPSTDSDWNIVAALAYAILSAPTEDVEAVEDVEEEVVEDVVEEVVDQIELSDAQVAIGVFGRLTGALPSTSADWTAVDHMLNGYTPAERDLAMEGAAIASFAGTFGYLPNSTSDWNIVAALAYDILGADEAVVEEEVVEEEATEEEVVEEEAVEEVVEEVVDQVELTDAQVAIGVFGKLTGALPSSSADWTAVDHMLDGYTPDERDLAMEGAAIGVFAGAFGYLPNSASDWNIIAALAYDILGAEEAVEEEATEEEVVEEEAAEEEVVEELSPEELAIGTFGKLAGALPSSDADWLAVDYILNGYTPAERDLSLEEAAIAMFGGVYGAVPSTDSDWNIIAAIAYSGAFDLDVEEAEVVVEEVGTVTIDETGTGWLRVRSTPEITDDNEVGQVTVGESYTYVETSEDGAWYKVVYDDAASEGWVFADYATLNE